MSAMLASDLNNPAFVGPVNPDSLLSAEFYMHAPEDVHASEKEGRVVRLPEMPYVRISVPGDHTSVMESPVLEQHKRRWPDRWLYFQIQHNMVEGAAEVPGWKIEEWTHLNPEQVRELKYMRFSVVEQVANASDAQCQKMGMQGMSLREAARTALRARVGADIKREMDKKDAEIATMKEQLARMEAFMAKMQQAEEKPRSAIQDMDNSDAAILDKSLQKVKKSG